MGVTVNCKMYLKIREVLKLRKLIIAGFSVPTCRMRIAASKIFLFRPSVSNQRFTYCLYSVHRPSRFGNNFISNYFLEVDYWFRGLRSVVGAILMRYQPTDLRYRNRFDCLGLRLRSGRRGWWHGWANHKADRSTAPLASSTQNLKT